ncbi:MAG: B12-binding domain-containing radical SAM protein, partial [Candidatus Omnitrophica bacterium]|nr:B12-binding domain-containing radical SAM protein [Candidatus Omnitrophota bacterium]
KCIRQKFPSVIIVAGGTYPSIFPEKYLTFFDYIIDGEGEEAFLELLKKIEQNMPVTTVAGIIYKEGGDIIRVSRKPLVSTVDQLPFPAYDLLSPPLAEYSRKGRVVKKFMAPILTSRGCPYQCIYCNKNIFGSNFRARSPQNIIDEIEFLYKNFSIRQIDILDDNFNLIPERAMRVMDMIIEKRYGLAINCHNGLRADRLDEKLAKKLKTAGVFKVGIGVESADEKILKKIKKDLDLNAVKNAVSNLRKLGIITHGYFILGLPGDNPASMQKTIDFAKKLNPHFINPATCIPFPGTALYEEVKQNGVFLVNIEDGLESGFFEGKVFFEIGPTLKKDVIQYSKEAFKQFYGRPYKIYDILVNLRSFQDFKWVVAMGWGVVMNIVRKKKYAAT